MITRSRSSLRGPMLPALAGSLAALLFVLACDAAVIDPPSSPSTTNASAARAREEQVQVTAAMGSKVLLRPSTERGPLVLVDGKVWPEAISAESLTILGPESIASIEIVKGPAAVARFGKAAANGAILITRLEASRKP